MTAYLKFISCILPLFLACKPKRTPPAPQTAVNHSTTITIDTVQTSKNTIFSRFTVPEGFERTPRDTNSFAFFLSNLPLKKPQARVTYFDGTTKPNANVYVAVVDLPIGKRDLHQCADAVMRLRADYLFEQGLYDSIHFNFTNGFKAEYSKWRKGKRIVVDGNRVYWKQRTAPSDDPDDFWRYLEMVFSYAGTASLSKEMKPVPYASLQIGDVFIKGGFPGHAVIVVDMATHVKTGKKAFLLAQSYMPAQEIQVLLNPDSEGGSGAWYFENEKAPLQTPEWVFKTKALKRF
ncbi:DUF4846 domain-containing protein [Maribacter sp. 2-571]|uniref:DUF4846 domain-containing protein n=1 Tax=Maribacter sp. 2-571 TaxID=3417569 RepID=UPI003D3261EA